MLVLSEEEKKKIKIFAGPSSQDLAKKVSEDLEMDLNLVKMNRFSDGEVFIKPEESVRGCKVFVIQSTSNPVNESIMELLVFIPVDHMEALPILAKHFIKYDFGPENTVVVSPDVGGVKRARGLAKWLHTPLAIIDKRRQKANECEVMNIIGDVEGKKVILLDDMIDTAGTICNAAKVLIERGAVKVYACATHAVFSGPAIERLKESVFTKIVVTDSIYLSKEQRFDKLRILSASEIFAETIKRIAKDEPISDLFELPSEQC